MLASLFAFKITLLYIRLDWQLSSPLMSTCSPKESLIPSALPSDPPVPSTGLQGASLEDLDLAALAPGTMHVLPDLQYLYLQANKRIEIWEVVSRQQDGLDGERSLSRLKQAQGRRVLCDYGLDRRNHSWCY